MIVTPGIVAEQCIELLATRHKEHLAALERQYELAPKTLEPLKTIDVLAGEGFRLREDTPPAVLLGMFGTAQRPQKSKHGLDITWTLAMEVTVVGAGRRDTVKRRDWYALTIVECVLQRLPRHAEPVDSIELADIDFSNGVAERQRTVGQAQIIFDVLIRGALDPLALPPTDTRLPPGSPGGAPADTYTPPVPPAPVRRGETSTTREPPNA